MMTLRLPFLLLAASASPLWGGSELDPLRTIAIQDGGRVKPLDTFSREVARRVSGAKPFTGGESVRGLEPVEWMLSLLAQPEPWQDEPIVRVTHAGLRRAVALPAGKDHYSFSELVRHEPLMGAAARVQEKLRQDGDARLDPIEEEVAALYDNLSLLSGIFTGEALKIVPRPGAPDAAWLSLADLATTESPWAREARDLAGALVVAYRERDRPRVRDAALALRERLRTLAPDAYPKAADLEREVRYNTLKPFRTSWVIYLLGFLLLLASFPLAARSLAWTGMGLLAAGFVMHTYGMVLRVLISGRAPVTNMYESVIFVAWGVVLFALVFEALYAPRYFAACASALALLCLILADNVPILNGSIEPLVPVLRDNMWLTLHVLTIALGYAALLLGMGLAHVNLGLVFFAPGREALLKALTRFLYRALQAGTLFLAAGILLGGVWASYSWGRFWGWDPKETWSLIALLGYLALLHGRFAGWVRDFGLAVGSILGFLLVLMAWYGVNFILGTGLHSYGFGAGGNLWVGGFAGFEILVVAGALLRRRAGPAPALPDRQPSAA